MTLFSVGCRIGKKEQTEMKGLTDEQVVKAREEHGSNALSRPVIRPRLRGKQKMNMRIKAGLLERQPERHHREL